MAPLDAGLGGMVFTMRSLDVNVPKFFRFRIYRRVVRDLKQEQMTSVEVLPN